MNATKIAAALRLLADAIEAPGIDAADLPTAAPAPAKRGPGRPAKGESAPMAAASSAQAPAPAASPASPPPSGVAQPAAQQATAATVKMSHKDLAPTFLAAAKAHGRAFVVDVMRAAGATGNPEPTFDKVPADNLPFAKELLLAGPQVKTVVGDEDLLG